MKPIDIHLLHEYMSQNAMSVNASQRENIHTHEMHSVMTASRGWYQIPHSFIFFFMFVHQPPRYRNLSFSSVCRSQKRKKKDVEKCTWNIMLLLYMLCFCKCNVTGMLLNKNKKKI